jgi:hypothetical protein
MTTTLKIGDELRRSGRISSSYSTSDIRCVTLVTNPVINLNILKGYITLTKYGTCPLQIAVLCNRTDVAHQLIRRENQHMKKYKGNCHLFQILTDLRQFEMLVACDIMCLFNKESRNVYLTQYGILYLVEIVTTWSAYWSYDWISTNVMTKGDHSCAD